MRRKGKVGRVGDKYLNILLQNGGTMTLKKTDFPSLVEDAEGRHHARRSAQKETSMAVC